MLIDCQNNKDSECNFLLISLQLSMDFDSHEGIIEPVAGQIVVKLILNNVVSSDTMAHPLLCRDSF